MINITIISIINNPELAAQMQKSVEDTRRELSCTYFMIDNINNVNYSSAASAYNDALKSTIDSEVYIICHQDILFLNEVLHDIYNLCKDNKDTLFGAAGISNNGKHGKTRIISSMALNHEGWNYTSLSRGTTQDVFTLDECLICGSKELFENLRFDEEVCNGWHLYVADLCMHCHIKGIAVKVFDATNIVHLSSGSTDTSFYVCESKLVKKYRKHFPIIVYTCGWTYTDPIRYACLKMYRQIRFGIKYNEKKTVKFI